MSEKLKVFKDFYTEIQKLFSRSYIRSWMEAKVAAAQQAVS